MKFRINSFISWAALSVAIVACTNDDTRSSSTDTTAVTVTAGIRTRAVNDQWQAGDAIAITMLKKGTTEVAEDATNRRYITDDASGNFTPTAAGQTIYFPQDGSEVSFKAFYPYKETVSSDFAIPVTVIDQSSLPAIDLMTAEHKSGTSKADPNVQLSFHHRLSKLIFMLKTEDGDQLIALEECALTIKGMKTTGTYHLLQESLSVDDASTADINIPMTPSVDQRQGIVTPRAAGAGISFEFTTRGGVKYIAYMSNNLELKGGYKYTFHITLKKNPVTVSAVIEDWIEAPHMTENAISISTPAGDSKGVNVNEVMTVFTGTDVARTEMNSYTYNGTVWNFTTSGKITYWEEFSTPSVNFYAWIKRAKLHDTQLHDYLVGKTTATPSNGVNFDLKHAAAQVAIQVQFDDSFTPADKNQIPTAIILPDYKNGASYENGMLINQDATAAGDITVRIATTEGVTTATALIQEQTIAAGSVIAKVTLENGRIYPVKSSSDVTFTAGVITKLTITLSKSQVTVSTKVIEWEEEKSIPLNAAIQISGSGEDTEGFTGGESIQVYRIENHTNTVTTYPYSYDETSKSWNGTSPFLYLDDVAGHNLSAAYFPTAVTNRPTITNGTFAWVLPPSQSTGYASYDWYIGNRHTSISKQHIHFTFKHTLSKVVVKLIASSDEFTNTDLAGAVVTLSNFGLQGTASVIAEMPGVTLTAGNDNTPMPITLHRSTTDEKEHDALVIPQIVSNIEVSVKLTGYEQPVTAKLPTLTFIANKQHIIEVTLKKTGISLSAKLEDWTPDNGGNVTID